MALAGGQDSNLEGRLLNREDFLFLILLEQTRVVCAAASYLP